MSEASKLAALLLHLEMNPEELEMYNHDPKYAREHLAHFGLQPETIDVVLTGSLEQFAAIFEPLRSHAGVGVAVIEPKHPPKHRPPK